MCVPLMCECACKYKSEQKDEAHSSHPFHFAAEVIHLSDFNCHKFMIALLKSGILSLFQHTSFMEVWLMEKVIGKVTGQCLSCWWTKA